jgi:hypothetical protein
MTTYSPGDWMVLVFMAIVLGFPLFYILVSP